MQLMIRVLWSDSHHTSYIAGDVCRWYSLTLSVHWLVAPICSHNNDGPMSILNLPFICMVTYKVTLGFNHQWKAISDAPSKHLVLCPVQSFCNKEKLVLSYKFAIYHHKWTSLGSQSLPPPNESNFTFLALFVHAISSTADLQSMLCRPAVKHRTWAN